MESILVLLLGGLIGAFSAYSVTNRVWRARVEDALRRKRYGLPDTVHIRGQ